MKIRLFEKYKQGLLKGIRLLTVDKRYSLIDVSLTSDCSGIGISFELFSFVNGETIFIRLNLIKWCIFVMLFVKHNPND